MAQAIAGFTTAVSKLDAKAKAAVPLADGGGTVVPSDATSEPARGAQRWTKSRAASRGKSTWGFSNVCLQ